MTEYICQRSLKSHCFIETDKLIKCERTGSCKSVWLLGNFSGQLVTAQFVNGCVILQSWTPRAQSANKVFNEKVGEGAEGAFVPHQNEIKLKHSYPLQVKNKISLHDWVKLSIIVKPNFEHKPYTRQISKLKNAFCLCFFMFSYYFSQFNMIA